MPFSRLLKRIVLDSGKTSKEIIEECEKNGKKVDKAYFSKLLNGKVQPPSEELTRLLARICNYDERQLVVENYFDKAPEEIKQAFYNIKEQVSIGTARMLMGLDDKSIYREIEKALKQEPMADFIVQILDSRDEMINSVQNDFDVNFDEDNLNFNITNPLGITIADNGMYPIVKENDKVLITPQEKYNINDILLFKVKKTNEVKARYGVNKDNRVELIPINKSYNVEKYQDNELIILGRINKIMRNI